jgi:hypothetical protein
MFFNGTTDILLDEHDNGSPMGLTLRDFWESNMMTICLGQPLLNFKQLPW